MINRKFVLGLCCAVALALTGCSRQQSDWQKTRETNTADAYEQFLKKYPSGEFTAQAQARVKELYEEHDWQKARDADTPEAYQGFLKQYPEGKWTEEARIRVENFTLAQAPSGNAAAGTSGTPGAPGAPGSVDTDKTAATVATKPVLPAPPALAAEVRPPAVKPATASSPRVAAHGGSYGVQLGAFKSGADAAHKRWANLRKEYPTLLAGLASTVKKTADGQLYRLQAVGLSEQRARDICSALKAKSQACVLVPPASAASRSP